MTLTGNTKASSLSEVCRLSDRVSRHHGRGGVARAQCLARNRHRSKADLDRMADRLVDDLNDRGSSTFQPTHKQKRVAVAAGAVVVLLLYMKMKK